MTGPKQHPLLYDLARLLLPRFTTEELQYLHHLVDAEQRSRFSFTKHPPQPTPSEE